MLCHEVGVGPNLVRREAPALLVAHLKLWVVVDLNHTVDGFVALRLVAGVQARVAVGQAQRIALGDLGVALLHHELRAYDKIAHLNNVVCRNL